MVTLSIQHTCGIGECNKELYFAARLELPHMKVHEETGLGRERQSELVLARSKTWGQEDSSLEDGDPLMGIYPTQYP